jgi:branched-chain amino acid transport system substrate-binding protein
MMGKFGMAAWSRRKVLISLVASILVTLPLVFGACSSGTSTTSTSTVSTTIGTSSSASTTATGEPYKVGAVFAVTGFNSPLGTPEKQTVELLVDQINARGGINGHPLEVVTYDTTSDTTECVKLVKRLIEQDGVVAIIGPSSTGESLALVDTVTKAQIPLISCAASAQIVQPVNERKWVFKTPQSDILAVKEIIKYLNSKSINKVALICDSAGFGSTGHDALVAALPGAGFTIVADEKFGTSDTDMTTQLTKINGAGPQAVICWGTNPGPALVAKNMKQLNMTIPLINSHGIANQKFIELAGDAANGVIFPAGKLLVADQLLDSDPQKAVLESYKTDFETKYGAGTINTFGGHAYDAVSIVVKALSAVGPDKANIRDYIENNIQNFPGTGGMFNMSPTDHNGLSEGAFVMIQIQNGKWAWLK